MTKWPTDVRGSEIEEQNRSKRRWNSSEPAARIRSPEPGKKFGIFEFSMRERDVRLVSRHGESVSNPEMGDHSKTI